MLGKDGNMRTHQWFTCGCCGSGFRGDINEQREYDQDTDFGFCESCLEWMGERNKSEMDKSISILANGMNDKNKEKFLGFERQKQEYVVMKAIDEGILTFHIGR